MREVPNKRELALLIGSRLRAMRKLRGTTLRTLSRRAGIYAHVLSYLERARTPYLPTLRTIWYVAASLGVSLADVLDGDLDPGLALLLADLRAAGPEQQARVRAILGLELETSYEAPRAHLPEHVGAQLSFFREQSGLSQVRAGARMSADAGDICRWETGRQLPQLLNFYRLCECYGVSAPTLLRHGYPLLPSGWPPEVLETLRTCSDAREELGSVLRAGN